MQTWDDMKAEHILCRQVIPGKGNSYFGPRQNASCEIGFTQLIIMINSLSELLFFFFSKRIVVGLSINGFRKFTTLTHLCNQLLRKWSGPVHSFAKRQHKTVL